MRTTPRHKQANADARPAVQPPPPPDAPDGAEPLPLPDAEGDQTVPPLPPPDAHPGAEALPLPGAEGDQTVPPPPLVKDGRAGGHGRTWENNEPPWKGVIQSSGRFVWVWYGLACVANSSEMGGSWIVLASLGMFWDVLDTSRIFWHCGLENAETI